MVKIMGHPIKMGGFGGTIIFGNTHIGDEILLVPNYMEIISCTIITILIKETSISWKVSEGFFRGSHE